MSKLVLNCRQPQGSQIKIINVAELKKRIKKPVKQTKKAKKKRISKEEYLALLENLKITYPLCFGEVKPLQVGINKILKKELGLKARIAADFFGMYCCSKAYKSTLVSGASRYDLQGKVAGIVE